MDKCEGCKYAEIERYPDDFYDKKYFKWASYVEQVGCKKDNDYIDEETPCEDYEEYMEEYG